MAVLVTRVNRLGIPTIRNIGATLTDERLTIAFANHANVSNAFQGLFLIKLDNIPDTSATEEIPVIFSTEGYLGSEKQLFTPQTVPVYANEVVDGVYLCFYDDTTGKLRVMM